MEVINQEHAKMNSEIKTESDEVSERSNVIQPLYEEDSPLLHAYDTLKGGDFLADQPPVLEMCLAAPGIIRMMDRFGCTFNRTLEGNLDVRRFGGTLYNRTAFCGASTGQQLLYSLDEQVRRYEAKGMVEKFENHEFMRLVLDDEGIARGIERILRMADLLARDRAGGAEVLAAVEVRLGAAQVRAALADYR